MVDMILSVIKENTRKLEEKALIVGKSQFKHMGYEIPVKELGTGNIEMKTITFINKINISSFQPHNFGHC